MMIIDTMGKLNFKCFIIIIIIIIIFLHLHFFFLNASIYESYHEIKKKISIKLNAET